MHYTADQVLQNIKEKMSTGQSSLVVLVLDPHNLLDLLLSVSRKLDLTASQCQPDMKD